MTTSPSPLRRLAIAAVAALPLAGVVVATGTGSAAAAGNDTSEKLRAAVTADALMAHLQEFQRIADANGGTRASGTPGYDASVDYIASRMLAAGYSVTRQPFTFPYFAEKAPAVLQRTAPTATTYETKPMTFSGSGDVTAAVTPVDLKLAAADRAGSTSGCEASDFTGFPTGTIALVQRGTCSFETKAANAQAAGAVAVIIFNQGNTEERSVLLEGTLGRVFTIPVVGASFATGEALAADGTTARVFTSTTNETRTTTNLIAQTQGGDPSNVVMLGAHLDSVEEGPGINDNATGSAALLEIALQAKDIAPTNQLRFAWWGAEEGGLLGAEHYVANLSEAQQEDIALYLNFDMIGSPNYVRFVYDGDDSVGDGNVGPAGSAEIEKAFVDYFASQGLATEPTDFSGRSDYGPFIAVGIPAGGLFTGAEEIKTAAQQAVYGGTAGIAYDPNYHGAGDTIANVDRVVFEQNADAIADALIRYAFRTPPVTPASPSPTATPTATITPPATVPPSPTRPASPAPGDCGTTTVTLDDATIIATGSAGVTVRSVPGSTVELYAYTRPDTTFERVRTATAGSDGIARFTIRPPANTRLYAVQQGCTTDIAANSVVLNVRTALSLFVRRNGQQDYTFYGDSLPARRGGLIVSLYRVTTQGRQVLTAQTRADATTGEWRIERRFTGTGRFGFVVRTGQDLQNAPGTSNIRSLLIY